MSEFKKPSHPEIKITDTLGRVIIIRKPDLLKKVNYKLAAGKDREILQNEIFALAWLVSIDGVVVTAPTALIDIKSLLQTLDDPGYDAVIYEIMDQIKQERIDAEEEPDEKKVD